MRCIPPKTGIPVSEFRHPPLGEDEVLILKDQAGVKISPLSGLGPAACYLTNKRLIVWQLNRMKLQVAFPQIHKLKTVIHYYVLKRRKGIQVHYTKKGRPFFLILITNRHDLWKRTLFQRALLKIDKPLIREVAARLDRDSGAILWHLWENRHATIEELSGLCNGKDHMDLLTDIRDAINPAAEKILGCPILTFERRQTDPVDGSLVPYSWWFSGEIIRPDTRRDRLLSMFDEDGYFQVILEVKGVEKKDLDIILSRRRLTISSRKTGHRWATAFDLPRQISYGRCKVTLKNQLLEIRIEKETADAPEN